MQKRNEEPTKPLQTAVDLKFSHSYNCDWNFEKQTEFKPFLLTHVIFPKTTPFKQYCFLKIVI